MTDELTQLKEKIVESGKLDAQELDKKIQEKLTSLGGLISEEGAAHIIANEQNITINEAPPSSTLLLKDLLPAMKNVTALVKVLKKYEVRTFGEDNQGKVGSLFVGDSSGFSRLTFWNDKTDYLKAINEGDVVEVQGAYVKENNNRTELHMGNASHCIVNPEGKDVTVKERQQTSQAKKLEDITDQDTFVTITATIVQAYDPRFFESCPECNKRLREEEGVWKCPQHGEVTPSYNYVMNVFLDDGTANIRGTLWKEQIQALLGKTHEEVLELKDNPDLTEEIKTELLGKITSARGRVKVNEAYNNKEIVLYSVEANPSPQENSSPQKEKKSPEKTSAQQKTKESSVDESSKSNVSEELMGDDDDDLVSIEDIDEDI